LCDSVSFWRRYTHSSACTSKLSIHFRQVIIIFWFLARDSIWHVYLARYMLSPVRLSVRPSVTRVLCSRKRLKIGLCNFHLVPSLYFFRGKFHPGILTGSHRAGTSNKGWSENKPFSSYKRQYLENGRGYVQSYY